MAVVLAGGVLLPCGACSQNWKFARADYPIPGVQLAGATSGTTSGVSASPARSQVTTPSDYSPWDARGVLPAGGTDPGPVFEPPQAAVFDPVPPVSDHASSGASGFGSRLQSRFHVLSYNIRTDHEHYYSWITMRDLLLGVAAGAALANTSLDEDFQDWYQDDLRSSGTDDFTSFWKPFGEGQIFIPAFAGLAVVGGMFEEPPLIGLTGEFGDRVTRSYLVGSPPVVFMQYCLGASRPGEAGVGSAWKPFDDGDAVSGHAFIGAVPFITAAKMTENPWAKSALYICSGFTAWSRVNDDAHYLSQACLGWWMAYLACRAVEETEQEDRYFTFTPMLAPEMAGIGMVVRR